MLSFVNQHIQDCLSLTDACIPKGLCITMETNELQLFLDGQVQVRQK